MVVKCILIFTMIVWKFIRREACQTIPLFRTEIRLQFHQREETPVLADIFNRLGYMERKGSGFGKIIGGYEFQINYDESKKPSFRSDRYQFTVVMPEKNWNGRKERSLCHRRCLKQYRRIVSLEALW